MRDKAHSEKSISDQKILHDHPWYSEFISKVMVSVKGELSRYELLLIDEVKGYASKI